MGNEIRQSGLESGEGQSQGVGMLIEKGQDLDHPRW